MLRLSISTGFWGEFSERQDLPDRGVTVVFVMLANTKIELLHPLREDSPIGAFLEKNPSGGIHPLCFEVSNIVTALGAMNGIGARVLGDGGSKIGAQGKPVIFAHPKDFHGALVEFEQHCSDCVRNPH